MGSHVRAHGGSALPSAFSDGCKAARTPLSTTQRDISRGQLKPRVARPQVSHGAFLGIVLSTPTTFA
jgi:hypothetical protein